MSIKRIAILLELDGLAEHPAGRASLPNGTARTFHGWLGLAEAIDALAALAGASTNTRTPPAGGRRRRNP